MGGNDAQGYLRLLKLGKGRLPAGVSFRADLDSSKRKWVRIFNVTQFMVSIRVVLDCCLRRLGAQVGHHDLAFYG
jgi:hypothetical protein